MNQTRIIKGLLAVLFVFLSGIPVSGQVRLAAMGGIQSTDFLQKNNIPGYDTSNGKYFSPSTGFQLGFLVEIPLSSRFFIQPGILYSSKGNQYERSYDSTGSLPDTLYNQHSLNLSYVEMPLYFTWKIPLSKNNKTHFYISAGPYFAFINSASEDYQNRVKQYNSTKYLYNSGTEDLPVGSGTGKYKTFDIGIAAKTGFEINNVLIGAYFSRGLTNAYTAGYPSQFHNQVFGGSIGIWLNKIKPPPALPADTDKDGTPDISDSCLTIAGIPKYHGCPIPDSDLDGINDEMDSCKFIAGSPHYHGCPVPDTDGDGVNDEEDSCRLIAGVPDYHGCPIPDTDKDGLNDEMDRCPDKAGPVENQGCPVIQPSIIHRAQLAAANVMFRTNSSELTPGSYTGLREIADSLKTNPDLHLLIEGYTDNIGKPAYNLKLSDERALAVKNVLLKLGIENNRIDTKGFGETNPIADNKTAAGRAQNRRVVFVFQLKNR